MTQLAKVFELNRKGLNVVRGVTVAAATMLLPLIVLTALHLEHYWISMSFGALFVWLSDPGGDYAFRVRDMALVGVIGALLTALGYGIGAGPWGFVVLAAFVVTVLAGLAMKFGVHRFVAAMLLNAWFLVEIALPGTYHLGHIHTSGWGQGLAWLIGSALTIAYTCIMWLVAGRTAQPEPIAEIPGGTAPVKLTRPLILFAVIRAIAIAVAVAIAFGLHLPNADWMPIAALVAMKPSLEQSTLVAVQRLAGAIIGAAVAALFLLTVDSKTGLEAVMVVLAALAGSIRLVNYALYCAAVAGVALIAMDLPHPSNLADEGQRVLYTFIGVGIGVLVMFLANLLQKRAAAKAAPPAPAHEGQAV
jgi:Fusaric acid resistance protein-like